MTDLDIKSLNSWMLWIIRNYKYDKKIKIKNNTQGTFDTYLDNLPPIPYEKFPILLMDYVIPTISKTNRVLNFDLMSARGSSFKCTDIKL